MTDPAIRWETERLSALNSYEILDTPPDGAFDRVTALAARHFDVPVALVSLVDEDRIWFKSRYGLDADQIWVEGWRCRGAVNRPSGGTWGSTLDSVPQMKPEGTMADDLDNLLQQHKENKKAAENEALAKDVEAVRRAEKCRGKFKEVVSPILNDWSARIQSQGHAAKVVEVEQIQQPNVGLLMTPEGPTRFPESQILFECSKTAAVFTLRSSILGRVSPTKEIALEKLNAEAVKDLLLNFVDKVLAASRGFGR